MTHGVIALLDRVLFIGDFHLYFGAGDWALLEGEGLVDLVDPLIEELSKVVDDCSCALISFLGGYGEAVE